MLMYIHVCPQTYIIPVFLGFQNSILMAFPFFWNFNISKKSKITKDGNLKILKSYLFAGRHVCMYVLPHATFFIHCNMLHHNINIPFLCHVTNSLCICIYTYMHRYIKTDFSICNKLIFNMQLL